MTILIIGQCTLHWGRMEFGNIGNYYIMEPMIRELYSNFGEDVKIKTTFQMSERFCVEEGVSVLPMDLYYGWNDNDLSLALEELSIATYYNKTGFLIKETPFIQEVMSSDLVIDFSGDIWGDNADFLGGDRFLVGLCKDRVAQLLNKKTVMIAGSPGPFNNEVVLPFAKEVFKNFDLVTNREAISVGLLQEKGFDISNVKSLACPAFLFEPTAGESKQKLLAENELLTTQKPLVGFILCGWNFLEGPFDKWPREDKDYEIFAEVIEYMINKLGVNVCVMSHSNGFPVPPNEFKLIHGRDYPIVKQLQDVILKRGNVSIENLFSLDDVYDAWNTKAIISSFDMLVSGRIHAAVAGFSQHVPTVVIDYGHEPKAHKLKGFAQEAGMLEYVASPENSGELKDKVKKCWENRVEVKAQLIEDIKKAKEKSKLNFALLKSLMDS